ncbi:hypothetical protein KJ766_02410, partial [Patescibacteria group bacterium]|nr:hypothetical protein [Patescibacteria group bacterium]
VEYAITPPYSDEAMVSYMYEEMRARISWDPTIHIADDEKDLLLYVAIHQTLLKSNIATLRFRILTLYYPDWPGASNQKRIAEISDRLEEIIELIESKITHPVTSKLSLLLRRKAGVFRVLHDVIEAQPDEFPILMDKPDDLDHHISKALTKRTQIFKTKLKRTVFRAVLFLFLTKMLLALLLEVPYDFLVVHETSLLPLILNITFPPILLAFIGMTVTISEKKNKEDYRGAVRALLVGADHDYLNLRIKQSTFSTWSKIFYSVYWFTFVLTYGFIAIGLLAIGFNWLSVTLFLFFLSLVTFFGIRIRHSAREIVLSDARVGITGSLFDVFMLPIVQAGRWLSIRVAKINVFIYFFDFIVEAPFKVAVRFVEGWIAFVREKKEEI